jgi:adenylate cyclase
MAPQDFKRKLIAILSADVKGYSRLMSEDEVGTIRTLNIYKEVMANLIQQHHGRVVDAPGDNLLAEFASVVDAVQCAVEIQKELKTRNAELPENRRMEFRIGVNLGDVVEDGEQILGDGVNIAARLESLSEAGGVCVSGTAFDQVENKLGLGYEYLGEQTVKNIAKPVRVYQVLMETEAVAQRGLEVASKEKMTFPLPDLPSIAVLPFENMSGDPKQEFFSDGITETIITALSKVPNLFVIAQNSTFTYKGKPVKVKQVSEELGVQYVLKGSVQKSGDRIRINVQLIDAFTGRHIWAERYDRDLTDIFALQDEITLKVLAAIQVKLTGAELSLGYGKYYGGEQGLDCYLKIIEGNDYAERYNIKDNNRARRIAEEALAMCPEVPMAYLLMANVHSIDYWLASTPRESLEKGIEMVQKTLALDDTLAEAHGLLGSLYTQKREYEKGIAEGERAVALNPSGATVLVNYASSLYFAGRSEEAIPLLQRAIRLNPFGPGLYYQYLGNALRMTGRFEEAVSAYKKAIQRAPDNLWSHILLTATYSMMDREKEAQSEAAEALRINPKFSPDFFAKTTPLKDKSEIDKVVNALRKAGLK